MILLYLLYSAFFNPLIYLSENQILYIFSTSAQVIAGLFGLSMAGYGFLNDTLNRAVSDDETLIDAITELRSRFYQTIILMGILAIVSVLLSLLCISTYRIESYSFISLIINISAIFIINEIMLIIFFAFTIIDPKKVERISDSLKREADKQTTGEETGDLSEFMKDFNQIESDLKKYSEIIMSDGVLQKNSKYSSYRLSNGRIAEFLYKNEKISHELFENLLSVIKYRNYVVHSTDVKVEKFMCDRVRMVKDELQKSLE
jgi:hypothetical protein